MAKSGKLRQALADALGLHDQQERIDVHLRNLREAGLISKAKKGRGAPEMGPTDAAHLLIAVAGSELAKDSVRSVQRYGSLRADPTSVAIHGGQELQHFPIPLITLKEDHTLTEALHHILLLLSQSEFFRDDIRQEIWRQPNSVFSPSAEYIFVRFFLPYDAASIHFGVLRKFHVQIVYGSLPVRNPKVAWDLRNIQAEGHLLTVRIVDRTALSKIANGIGQSVKQ
jgi:hypothetical protein